MKDGKRCSGPRGGGGFYLLGFALSHAGCGDAVIEARLGERLLACWCLHCYELRTFGEADPEVWEKGRVS